MFSVYADEIILCAGAIGTPHILLLSGVGPADHLNSFGIPAVQDLPGVGHNLRDHPYVPLCYLTKPDYPLDLPTPPLQVPSPSATPHPARLSSMT